MQEPVFWLFIEGSKQSMVEQKGDKNTNSRNNGTVKTDSSRIEGIHFMPKIAPSDHLSFKDSVHVHTCDVLTYVASNQKYSLLRTNSKCQAAYEHHHM